jgi:hypothetical protein
MWALDPGVTDLYVAVDGAEDALEVRKTSNAEYHHLSGSNLSQQRSSQWRKIDGRISAIEDSIPSPKTSMLTTYDSYISQVHVNYEAITTFYNVRFNREKFKRYIKKQKALVEICKRVTSG